MVMEREYGRAHMRRFLKYELDRYLEGRGGETLDELPLYRVENQQYIHYRKGSLAFYRLREEIGEQALNRALQRFLQAKAFQQAPYTTSAELLQAIRAEAGPDQQAMITDLFERITFYDNRVVSAQARKRPDGRFDVTVQAQAAVAGRWPRQGTCSADGRLDRGRDLRPARRQDRTCAGAGATAAARHQRHAQLHADGGRPAHRSRLRPRQQAD